ncbi:MAG TPA: sulfatase-like hydrolase/transferase [Puia sp.]|jgi:cellulose synthase/poly-beta-1,6-N-acetylglucosamine synthase-like glycosyltransferase/phosphoglycerol transferase MdoB-like AlkP superfamily enzyme|nr:sulfatase-like hydrolase/transferase [Puia sp.]
MNWDNILTFCYYAFTYGIFTYSVVLVAAYLFIATYSIGETRKYLHKNSFTDYRILAVSRHAPSVSILAPAYNEGKTIVENVRSLLSIYYHNLELIIINDGSKDDSLQRLIDAYQLKKTDLFFPSRIPTRPVKGIYKSTNPVYGKLVVVDKVNGGKADALNAGINLASNNYLVCIDVDCVLEQDALLKMIKPFLEQTDEKVIASGGVIRVANSCIIEDGRLIKVNMPEDYLPRMQCLEYIRAFILGRMAWSRLNGLMLISGAFGAFDREIVIRCGGYNPNTVGEDMELVVRMRRYMEEQQQKYRVTYIPDPLCWTEVPSSFAVLERQRNRWARGMSETLKIHRKMFFNPRYHLLGMLSYPYWFFFELCSPVIEFFGIICFFLFILLGFIDWEFFITFLLFITCFGYLYSAFAILMEVITYNQYRRRMDILRLLLAALTEPFCFHPFVVWSSIKGYIDLLKKKGGWGDMKRRGFAAKPVTPETAKPKRHPLSAATKTLFHSFREYLGYATALLLLSACARAFELISDILRHGLPPSPGRVIGLAYLKDLAFFAQNALAGFFVFSVLYALHKRTARISFIILSTLLLFVQLALSAYFLTTLAPLGADLWAYSLTEIRQTVGAAGGVSLTMTGLFALAAALSILVFIYLPPRIRPGKVLSAMAFIAVIAAPVWDLSAAANSLKPGTEYSNNLSLNKSWYFYTATAQHFFHPQQLDLDIYSNAYIGEDPADPTTRGLVSFNYINEKEYPFLHALDTTSNVLSPFFNKAAAPPNIVIVLVEGLGRAFTNRGAYLGNFTPFLDSLSNKSLYWENFLSSGGRTFAVLPSLTGSLPFGRNGFNELGENMPPHLSLLSLLKDNGYRTSFYYGGDAHFDNMDLYLKKSQLTSINDEKTYPPGYSRMPSTTGFSWGYGDRELFRRYFEVEKDQQQPYANVLLTVATHSPFFINEQDLYLKKFEHRMDELGFTETTKRQYRDYQYQYASILFMDDALRYFLATYSKRADFKNTIFLITGDHRMPEIPMISKIDRYHVPLIIYSPLLQRTAAFSSVSTHFDITPSLLVWLRNDYHLHIPLYGSWMGSGLDTTRSFRNIHTSPLMQTKNDLVDFVMGEYLLNANDLYRINSSMQLTAEPDDSKTASLKTGFQRFKQKNEQLLGGARLIPDSLYQAYFPR